VSTARVLIEDGGKLNMNCRCGAQMPVRDTGKSGVGVTRCRECRAIYDYSCWEIRRTPEAVFHMVEAFVRKPPVAS
jgi:hypothetical protein